MSPVLTSTSRVEMNVTPTHPIKPDLMSPHCSMMPREAGMKNTVMFPVRNSATGLIHAGLTSLNASEKKSSSIPITLPGMKCPVRED